MSVPSRGDVWLADLDPTKDHEQSGRRPVLVLSEDAFNRAPPRLVVVLPMTSKVRNLPTLVPIEPPEGGVRVRTAIRCDQIRTISIGRLVAYWGSVRTETLGHVGARIRLILGI